MPSASYSRYLRFKHLFRSEEALADLLDEPDLHAHEVRLLRKRLREMQEARTVLTWIAQAEGVGEMFEESFSALGTSREAKQRKPYKASPGPLPEYLDDVTRERFLADLRASRSPEQWAEADRSRGILDLFKTKGNSNAEGGLLA